MRKTALVGIISLCVMFSGCSFVSQSEYDSLLAEKQLIESENSALKQENAVLQSEKNDLDEKFNSLTIEHNNLKEETVDWVKKSDDEKAAALAKAEEERIKAEEAAKKAKEEADKAEAEKIAQEEAERLAEEAKGYETGITYNDLARSPEEYKGKKVKFTGNILQIINEETYVSDARMSTNGKYEDVIYIIYETKSLGVRLLEDDNVTIYGTADELLKYTTVAGTTMTIPKVIVDRIELNYD